MKDLTISSKKTIRHAMKFLSKTAEQCLFVIDKNGKLLGTITDGDIRRGILEGINNKMLALLAKNNFKSLDDFAGLSNFDLLDKNEGIFKKYHRFF